MSLKGGYGKLSTVCTESALAFHKVVDLARTGYQAEHFFELQMAKQLLATALTGVLPHINIGGVGVTPIINAALLAEDKLLAGWNKLYPATAKLNTFYDSVKGLKGVPGSYIKPSNTPADHIMTVLSDWGNMQNMLLIEGQINWVKGKLFSLYNPMSQDSLKKLVTKALAGDAKAAKKIEVILQSVLSVFNYMNDAGAELTWRVSYMQIDKEIQNMDQYMPELKGLKAIWDEFPPAYQEAVAQKSSRICAHGRYPSQILGASSQSCGQCSPWTARLHY
ncbi:hypothetical protein PT974_01977 [Cladobotryum mycophilum]|uniref:Uncharacterized protein n=1 Tax=Cladobotryum mycophilum TaxID=491253 RepID=A0ABR0SWS3_9HYPO